MPSHLTPTVSLRNALLVEMHHSHRCILCYCSHFPHGINYICSRRRNCSSHRFFQMHPAKTLRQHLTRTHKLVKLRKRQFPPLEVSSRGSMEKTTHLEHQNICKRIKRERHRVVGSRGGSGSGDYFGEGRCVSQHLACLPLQPPWDQRQCSHSQ